MDEKNNRNRVGTKNYKRTNKEENRNRKDGANRLRWLGHVSRMGSNRLPPQAMKWMPKGGRRNRKGD